MKNIILPTLLFTIGSSLAQAGDCVAPDKPELPDGATASLEQMLAGQSAVRTFQAANIEYMGCLEGDIKTAEKATQSASEEEKESAQSAYETAVETYNDAVSMEEEVAGQFNIELREYKAANPG